MTRIFYFFILVLLYTISSCAIAKKETLDEEKVDTPATVIEETFESFDIDEIIDSDIKKSESFFYTQRIDSTEFVRLKKKYNVDRPSYVAITNLDSVSTMLDDVVVFRNETEIIERFNFRNGQSLELPSQDDFLFVAYYPEFDIIRLEGGHAMDLAYNLSTGYSIENIGLPPYMKFSPNKQYLFNGYYSGQAFDFFIQQKDGNSYKTLGYMDWAYDYIRDYFWINDSTLCLDIPDLYRYLLLTIKVHE